MRRGPLKSFAFRAFGPLLRRGSSTILSGQIKKSALLPSVALMVEQDFVLFYQIF
jgi:hypothetical protein